MNYKQKEHLFGHRVLKKDRMYLAKRSRNKAQQALSFFKNTPSFVLEERISSFEDCVNIKAFCNIYDQAGMAH